MKIENLLFADEFPYVDRWEPVGYGSGKELHDAISSGATSIDVLADGNLLWLFSHFVERRGFENPGFFFDRENQAYFAIGINEYIQHISLHYLKVRGAFSLHDIKLIRRLIEKGGSFDTLHYSGRGVLPPARIVSQLCWIGVERIDSRLFRRWLIDVSSEQIEQLYDDYVRTLMREGTFGLERTEFGTTIIPPDFIIRDWAAFADKLHVGAVGQALLRRVNYLPFDLIRRFRSEPALMREISPRDFEMVVAELLLRLEFDDVVLTPRSNDGGKDIVARRTVNDIPMKFFFECKRYGPDRKVGIPELRSLLGSVAQHGAEANIGVLATTSTFTRDGIEMIASDARLDGKNIHDLGAWLDQIMA